MYCHQPFSEEEGEEGTTISAGDESVDMCEACHEHMFS